MSKPQSPPKVGDKTPPKPGTPGAWTKPPPLPTVEPVADKSKLPKVKESGGPEGPEPTRYGDWEVKGRVSDF